MKIAQAQVLAAVLVLAGCSSSNPPANTCDGCIEPGSDDQTTVQKALIDAQPNSTVQLAKGTFHFTDELSMQNVAGVTVKGQGTDTILDFAGQTSGGSALSFQQTNGLTVRDLAVLDSPGDAIRIENTAGVTVDSVKISWTAGSVAKNGSYGVYPVTSSGIHVLNSTVSGASDTGIYIGQSHDVIVEKNDVFGNVAGIELENTTNAEVRQNHSHGNAAGILVFNLPELQVKNGHIALIHDNLVESNNHDNFAAAGNIVSNVPAGIGILVAAADDIEITRNTITGNESAGVAVASFEVLVILSGATYNDPVYDPIPQSVNVHDNLISGNGLMPSGVLLDLGGADVLWDGRVDATKPDPDGSLRICATNNGATATFLRLGHIYPGVDSSTDATLVNCTLTPIPPVTL